MGATLKAGLILDRRDRIGDGISSRSIGQPGSTDASDSRHDVASAVPQRTAATDAQPGLAASAASCPPAAVPDSHHTGMFHRPKKLAEGAIMSVRSKCPDSPLAFDMVSGRNSIVKLT